MFSKSDAEKKLITTSVQSTIIALFAAFTAFASNPFLKIFPIPKEGLGLNPLLQDIGLALHPPMLYAGYLGSSLIFSFAIAGLLTEKIDRKFAADLKNYLFFSWGFLTAGIALGAWWAYRELGWGGYWFWDPVENISLMPWIATTALIHCVRILEQKEIFKIWTAFLAILNFLLGLIGIFLTRSGLLTSVHSFAIDAKRGFFIIFLILLIGGFGMLVLGAKMPQLKNDQNAKTRFWSKTGLILLNNYFLVIALFILLLGSLYPIFLRGFFNQFIAIGPSYYNAVFGILIAPFLFFMAISSAEDFLNRRNCLILLISLAIAAFTFFYHQKVNFIALAILFLATFAIFLTIIPFKKLKNKPVMSMAHIGFSVAIIGVVLSSALGLVKEVNLKKSDAIKMADFDVEFSEVEYRAGKNFLARQGDFIISKNHQKLAELKPQMRYYPISEQTTFEAAIDHGIFGDFYLVLGNKDENENYALRAYYKPFIWLIWFGAGLIFFAAILQILKPTGLAIFSSLQKSRKS